MRRIGIDSWSAVVVLDHTAGAVAGGIHDLDIGLFSFEGEFDKGCPERVRCDLLGRIDLALELELFSDLLDEFK